MFKSIESAGTSNINEHLLTSENISDTKCAVDVKIERESDDEVEIEIDFDRAIKVEPEDASPKIAKCLEPGQNPNSYEHNGSITIEIEPMPTVKQEPAEEQELYADHETKCEMVIEPDVLQVASYMMEETDTYLPKKLKLETMDEDTDQTEEARAYIQTEETVELEQGTSRQVGDNNISLTPSFNLFSCDDCGKHFNSVLELSAHIESHEKIKHKIYLKCKDCSYQTFTEDSLERHKRLHDKSRLYVCEVCSYRFKNNDTMQKHMKSVHSDKKMHECDICDYKTNNFGHLSNHLRVHTEEKPYPCSVCEYRFTQKSSLTTHLRIHAGVKPYACTVCEKRFTEKCTLKIHLRIHTGERPYSCTVCEYKFARKSNLTRHLKTHTGDFSNSVKTIVDSTLRVNSEEKP